MPFASITNPWTNPWNFHNFFLRIGGFENLWFLANSLLCVILRYTVYIMIAYSMKPKEIQNVRYTFFNLKKNKCYYCIIDKLSRRKYH